MFNHQSQHTPLPFLFGAFCVVGNVHTDASVLATSAIGSLPICSGESTQQPRISSRCHKLAVHVNTVSLLVQARQSYIFHRKLRGKCGFAVRSDQSPNEQAWFVLMFVGAVTVPSLLQTASPGGRHAGVTNNDLMFINVRCKALKLKVRQVVQNMRDIVHGSRQELARQKTLTGCSSKCLGFFIDRLGVQRAKGLTQPNADQNKPEFLLLDEQKALDLRLEN